MNSGEYSGRVEVAKPFKILFNSRIMVLLRYSVHSLYNVISGTRASYSVSGV